MVRAANAVSLIAAIMMIGASRERPACPAAPRGRRGTAVVADADARLAD
jgi:hypothetical protein